MSWSRFTENTNHIPAPPPLPRFIYAYKRRFSPHIPWTPSFCETTLRQNVTVILANPLPPPRIIQSQCNSSCSVEKEHSKNLQQFRRTRRLKTGNTLQYNLTRLTHISSLPHPAPDSVESDSRRPLTRRGKFLCSRKNAVHRFEV